MKGDFTRDTFDPGKHFTRVLMQQGRVQLDADWNEQTAILLHYLRTLASDLIGPHGGPQGNAGFAITAGGGSRNFQIGAGRYYVDGILCENPAWFDENGDEGRWTYEDQPDYPFRESDKLVNEKHYLVYLDVWERHISYIQDDRIREVGLGGPDTATRAKVIWQVKAAMLKENWEEPADTESWRPMLPDWPPGGRGRLKAGTKQPESGDALKPCLTPPEARYRGAENQLYRVEIHNPGTADDGATFKWSRDNGSVVFPIRSVDGGEVLLEHLGRDDRFGLKVGDWVEVVDEESVLRGEPGLLARVSDVHPVKVGVTLELPTGCNCDCEEGSTKHPFLRRWDQKPDEKLDKDGEGALLVQEEDKWIELEDGVQVCFESAGEASPHHYRTGDYWMIPARTATRDVEWPNEKVEDKEEPKALPPHGVDHHYAPLVVIDLGQDEVTVKPEHKYWCKFPPPCPRSAPVLLGDSPIPGERRPAGGEPGTPPSTPGTGRRGRVPDTPTGTGRLVRKAPAKKINKKTTKKSKS